MSVALLYAVRRTFLFVALRVRTLRLRRRLGIGLDLGRNEQILRAMRAHAITLVTALTLGAPGASAETSLGVELGPAWFSRNDIRIPGDDGSRFDMTRLTGDGADFYLRAQGAWDWGERHGLRLVLAPLEVSGTGTLAEETQFDGTTFAPGPAQGSYRFSTYKLTYRYTFHESQRWRWRVGLTGLIRDAEVSLRQGAVSERYDNVGLVPLLHLSGDYRLSERWGLSLDFDGLAGGPGYGVVSVSRSL